MSAASQATKERIERAMKEALGAVLVDVVDESWKHAGHAGAASGGGHFALCVVSDRFAGLTLLDRNRMIYSLLSNEMGGEIHALSITALTPQEWQRREAGRA